MKTAAGPGSLELRDIPLPAAGPGQVVARVAATGICGTDLHIQDGEYRVVPPLAIGHETAGTVVEVNGKLKDQAPLVNQDPEGAGWLAIVQLDNPKALDDYLTEEQYLATLTAH